MKKRVAAPILAVIMMISLASCGSGEKTADVEAATIWTTVEEALKDVSMPLMMEVDSSSLEKYYDLSSDEVADFVGRMPMMNVAATEILIVKAQKGKADVVRTALEARQAELDEAWSGYLEDQYLLVTDYRLVQNGNWFLYVIGDHADAIVHIFNGYTQIN